MTDAREANTAEMHEQAREYAQSTLRPTPMMNGLKNLVLALALQAAVVAASAQFPTLITPTNTTWRYFTNGTDPGMEWALPGFEDTLWPQGQGLFGNDGAVYAPLGFNTPIPSPFLSGRVTVYFRTHFNWYGSRLGVVLGGTNYVDDGCVVYLNGVEITRFNMPAGPPAFDTLALFPNPGGYPNQSAGEPVRVLMEITLDSLTNGNANPLVNGDNVLAVEVHQNVAASSDVVFGMSLFAGQCSPACTDGFQPTNRGVLVGRSTTFIVDQSNCAVPMPTFQWYRNVGAGEELIPGATASSYTLTNAQVFDAGAYYCRLINPCGTVDSRQAILTVISDGPEPPLFLSASVVGPGLHTFRLVTDEELCGNGNPPPEGCGTDFKFGLNWQILQADNPSMDLGVVGVAQINPTTYEFTTSLPRDPAKRYQITVNPEFGEIGDRFNHLVPPGAFAETGLALSFAQGVGGYWGAQDAEIHSHALADTPLGNSPVMKADLDDAGIAQGLLRFDGIIGNSANQIPFGTRIISATLTLDQIDPGVQVNLHRMLVPWDQTTVTWNSLVDGVSDNDVEARFTYDATKPVGTTNGPVDLDVTASVQAWAYGQPNYGWALLSTGADGWRVNTSESGIPTAPFLTVEFFYIDECIIIPTFVTQPPASLFVAEGQSFTLGVALSNAIGALQWTRNGVDIPGANQPSYTVQYATPLDAGTYRLRIHCPFRGTIAVSSPSVVTVGDCFRPELIGATTKLDGDTITLHFSKRLNAASAQNPANYTIAPPLAVNGVVLSNDTSPVTVTLTTAPREIGSNYTLRIANVTDTCAIPGTLSPNPTLVTLTSARIIVPWSADGWRYNTNNLDAAPDWKNPDFTPGPDWGSGSGLFGLESSPAVIAAAPAPIATSLSPNSVAPGDALVTTYFRKAIHLPALPAGARYVICHYTDDGFIAYLDGAEIQRFAMPAGAVTFTDRSTGIPTGEATYRSFALNATPGGHTLAVELHQAGATSSDVLFGMEVRLVDGTSPSLSIVHSFNGGVSLNWNADGNWQLRSAAAVTGPYLDVAIPPASRLGTFTLPGTSVTNRSFFLLDYTGRP